MEPTFHTKVRIPKGIHISEPEPSDPVVEKYPFANKQEYCNKQTSWCYIFIHHSKVDMFTSRLDRDKIRYFIHKNIIYQRRKYTRGIQSIEKPTVSGLVFLQGTPSELQHYIDTNFPLHHLVNNCSTHLPAVIADSVMQPFMRVMETSPDRIRFLLRPFKYYAGGNIKLRLVSGFLAGIEGYVIRIDRDRRLVMDVGGMSVAISGIYCEKFEVVEEEIVKIRQVKQTINSPQRNLIGLQAMIDRELYMPSNKQEVELIAEVLELWKERATLYLEKGLVSEATEILFFLLEEIDYHYSSLFSSSTFDLSPILTSVRIITSQIDAMASHPDLTEEIRQGIAAERDSCQPRFGYLFI